MRGIRTISLLVIASSGPLLAGCSDGGKAPTAVDRSSPPQAPRADVIATALEPFTYRAAIDPYMILQLPEFMIQERVRSDIVMQRSVLAPGPGAWHTNSGPSFVYVIQGQIKTRDFSNTAGCTDSPVHGPGAIFFVPGDHIHRAIVVSSESAVLLITRFNIPVGGPITNSVSDPGC